MDAVQIQSRRMISGGPNLLDLKIAHRERHSLKERGKWDEAEAKFCEALVGCQVLLSPASEHTEKFDLSSSRFPCSTRSYEGCLWSTRLDDRHNAIADQSERREIFDHLLKIAELIRQWKGLEEAKTFGKVLVQLVDTTYIERERSATERSAMIPKVATSRFPLIETLPVQGFQSLSCL